MGDLTGQCKRARRGEPFSAASESRLKKVREGIGLEKCRVIVTGAAPMPPYLMEFLRVCFFFFFFFK